MIQLLPLWPREARWALLDRVWLLPVFMAESPNGRGCGGLLSLSIKSHTMYKYSTKPPVMSKRTLRLGDERWWAEKPKVIAFSVLLDPLSAPIKSILSDSYVAFVLFGFH